MEREGESSNTLLPMEGEGEGSHDWWSMEGELKGSFSPFLIFPLTNFIQTFIFFL
jgi:hypothetical protein